jgi:hypothetical protein
MQRTVSAGLLGVGLPVLRHAPAILAGMSPGGKKIGSSGSTTAVNGATPVASASSDDTSVVTPAAAQARCDSWSNHRPMMFRRNRMVPSTPPSLVKFANRASSLSTGSDSSTPTSDQVPHEM